MYIKEKMSEWKQFDVVTPGYQNSCCLSCCGQGIKHDKCEFRYYLWDIFTVSCKFS